MNWPKPRLCLARRFLRAMNYPRREHPGHWRRWLPTWWQTLTFTVLGLLGTILLTTVLVILLPYPRANTIAVAQLTTMQWRDGTVMASVGEANRKDINLDAVSQPMRDAILAAEDHDFYKHSGFSLRAIVRAAVANATGGVTQGGSTITQQYAKNAFLSQDRTGYRKFREILLSIKLETQVDKSQILQDYLNTIWFGRDSYGIQTASWSYFRTNPADLNAAQSAMLAALVRAPGQYDPDRHHARLVKRWNYILDQMVQIGTLSAAQRSGLQFPRVVSFHRRQPNVGRNGYLIAAVNKQLRHNGFSQRDIDLGGLRVTTTFDSTAQSAMDRAVTAKGPRSKTKGLRIGGIAMDPATGQILAMYGGKDYLTTQLNNATGTIGQAGSTFKAFALAAALENGYTLKSRVNGRNGQTFGGYTVHNFANENFGKISLLDATVHSVNNAYVGVTHDIGAAKVMDAAIRAGIPATTPGLAPVLSIALGTCSPHDIDLAKAYATFAAHGQTTTTSFISQVADVHGRVLWTYQPTHTQAFSRDIADTVTYALRNVVQRGTGVAAGAAGRPAAGKTGTTNGNLAAWFVGYTPSMTAAFMLTKDDSAGHPISLNGTGGLGSVTGGSFPARIWGSFVKKATRNEPWQDFDLKMTGGLHYTSHSAWSSATSSTSATPSASATGSTPTDSATPTDSLPPTDTPAPSASVTPTDSLPATDTPTPTDSVTPTPTLTGPG